MTEKTNIQQGYKDSPLGIIPMEWEVKRLGEVAEVKGGYAFDSKKMSDTVLQYQIVKMGNLYGGTLDLSRCRSYWGSLNEIEKDYLLKEGDIIITLTGTVGKRDYGNSVQIKNEKNLLLNQRNAKIVSKTIDNCFLFLVVNSERFLYQFFYSSRGGTGSQTNVGIPDIEDIRIIVPPTKEQKGISNIASLWDTAIEKQSELIKKLKLRKRTLMQQLLTGKKRLPGFSGEWRKIKAGELFTSSSIKGNPDEVLLSATQEYGVIPRDQLEGRVTMPKGNLGSFKLVEEGDFVISLRSFQGGIEYSKYRGIVSPAYNVLKPIIEIDKAFYQFYFKSSDFIGHLAVAVIGIRDGKQISYDDFCFVKIPYPNIDEQKAISCILLQADKEIELANEKLASLQSQKRGLMQQLLTGKKRIKELKDYEKRRKQA